MRTRYTGGGRGGYQRALSTQGAEDPKLNDYAAVGVRWYWIVDLELRSFEILERGPGALYVHALAVTAGVIDPVPGCEGLTLDLDELWAEIDRLPGEQA